MPIPQMRVPNDLHFDTETYLLFSIYYAANGILEGTDGSAAAYVETFAKEIAFVKNIRGRFLEPEVCRACDIARF
jgi:hypothetical protein